MSWCQGVISCKDWVVEARMGGRGRVSYCVCGVCVGVEGGEGRRSAGKIWNEG